MSRHEPLATVLACLLLGAAGALVVGIAGGPGWAQWAVGWLTYFITLTPRAGR